MTKFTEDELDQMISATVIFIDKAETYLDNLTNNENPVSRLSAYASGNLEKAVKTVKIGNEAILKLAKTGEKTERKIGLASEVKECLKAIEQWEKQVQIFKDKVHFIRVNDN